MKPVSDQLFAFENRGTPALTHERCSAKDLGLEESWLRDAIFKVPDLVISPCRAAGLTEDEWYPWQREYKVDVAKVDVLLLSSQGRVAIVETKLASNPELRRRVLAQALDYLTHLAESFDESIESAAAELGITARAYRARAQRGQVPVPRRFGGRLVVLRSELDRWLLELPMSKEF